jgi:D-alanine-D-alanine ligase-like ATP-grasp enzyme
LAAQLIFHYILWCIRLCILPWRYFQLNAKYFNSEKGYFSKLEIDVMIPERWRLPQYSVESKQIPKYFPVFIKPEWGQNSYGIRRIDNIEQYRTLNTLRTKMPFMVQEASKKAKEYEIFYIAAPNRYSDKAGQSQFDCAVLTIVEVENLKDKTYPINSINNKDTNYQDITNEFNDQEIMTVKKILQELPYFRIARVGLKANSKKDFLAGDFDIIEINLFAPMPLNLLDNSIDQSVKKSFIKSSMYHLAKISTNLPKQDFKKMIFFKKIIRHYQVKSPL